MNQVTHESDKEKLSVLTTDFNTYRFIRSKDEQRQGEVIRQLHNRPRIRANEHNPLS